MIVNIPSTAGSRIDNWIRKAATAINQLASENTATIYTWDRGCKTVPTNTTIAGAEELVFQSPFTGNGTLVITVFDAEGGVNVALNGVELGSLSGTASQEVLYEVAVTNLVEGDDPLNSFKIWSTTGDTAELRKLEVYRNFVAGDITDSAIWGNITGSGKPEDNAATNRPTFGLRAGRDAAGSSSGDKVALVAYDTNGDPLHDATAKIAVDGSLIDIGSGSAGETAWGVSIPDGTYYVLWDVTKAQRFTHSGAGVDRDAAFGRVNSGQWQYWEDHSSTDAFKNFTSDDNYVLIGEAVRSGGSFTAASAYAQGVRLGAAPELASTVGADFQTNLTNKPKDTFNLWADPQFEQGTGALESLNNAHTLVTDPLSKFNGAIQLAGSTANKKSILITIPASAGQTIFTEWWAHKDGSVNSGADVGLTFRWVDGADEQISQTTDLQDESAMSTGAWTKFTGSSIAPANTATVGLRVENRTSHTAGNFFLSMVSFRSATPALWDDVSGAAKPDDNATVGANSTNLAADSVDADSVIAGTLSFKFTDLDTQLITMPDGTNFEADFDPTQVIVSTGHEITLTAEAEFRSKGTVVQTLAVVARVFRRIDGGSWTGIGSAVNDSTNNVFKTVSIEVDLLDEPGDGDIEYFVRVKRVDSSSTAGVDGESKNAEIIGKVVFFK